MEDIEQYIGASESTGMKIQYVIDTHAHANHISGGARLAEATGATYVLGRHAAATIPHDSVSEGDVLFLGSVELNVLETPGHTPEHITIAVVDRTRGDEPWCPSATIATGGAIQLTATVLADGGAQLDRAVTWCSSDSSIASVSSSGLVSGLGAGDAQITATSEGAMGTATVVVRTGIQAISAGGLHTCGVATGGAVYCWGFGLDGRLGNGIPADRATPEAVAEGLTFASISAGEYIPAK